MTAGSGTWRIASADDMRALGVCLGKMLRAGDVVLMDGELGAGKTTLTKGIAEGIGVLEPVTSPTFVIAREHPATTGVPGLVHVDAYRLRGPDEMDDLDLAPAMSGSVTVVEWAAGVAEHLHADPLVLSLRVEPDDTREVSWQASGDRWLAEVSRVAGCAERSSPRSAPGQSV